MTDLIPVREAQERILTAVHPRPPQNTQVTTAYGRVLANDIFAPINLPSFMSSAMDGFAVHNQDVQVAALNSPVILKVTSDIPAGQMQTAPLQPGCAARIMTGAALPPEADSVIPVEETDQVGAAQSISLPNSVKIFNFVNSGQHTRQIGEDIRKGQLVLPAGRKLQPQDIGLLVSLGIQEVLVSAIPRVAIFSSGDELLSPGQPFEPGKIYDSNRYLLTGLIRNEGAEVIQLEIARDNPESILQILNQIAADPPDLILSSAGVSVGVFDYVRQVLEQNGSLSFWRINMRPGKPLAFGYFKDIPFFGLPGNPVSAYICCAVFALPVIRNLLGLPPLQPRTVKAVLSEPLESSDGRESYYRGILNWKDGMYSASLTGHQGSGNLFSLVQANALLIVPAGVKMIPAGAEVTAWLLGSITN
ncbi:MAG TPA: gephyrin-like molybdotransferase Glp [Leptolinea sp.]